MRSYFYYSVLLPHGKVQSGIKAISVELTASAVTWLERYHGGIVLSIYKLPAWFAKVGDSGKQLLRPGIKPAEMAGLLRDLAVMTASGINIIDAVKASMDDDQTVGAARVRHVARQLLDDLNAGITLGVAFERQQSIFPESVRSLARIGDETGRMDEMLMEAAKHIERVQSLKADAKQAMIYPAASFLAIFGAAGFWIVYVMPKLVGLFKQMNAKLPPLTQAVLSAAEWSGKNWQWPVLSLIFIVVACTVLWVRSIAVRRLVMTLLHKMPISRTLLISSGLAFFSEYLSLLIRSGLDLVNSLSLLEKSTQDIYYKERIVAIRQFLERGDRLSVAMKQVGGFPSMMTRMIGVGEDSGTLDKQLSFLADEYSMRLKRTVATLAELIKPLVIVVAGAVFLFFIVALLLPVYDLVQQTMAGPR